MRYSLKPHVRCQVMSPVAHQRQPDQARQRLGLPRGETRETGAGNPWHERPVSVFAETPAEREAEILEELAGALDVGHERAVSQVIESPSHTMCPLCRLRGENVVSPVIRGGDP